MLELGQLQPLFETLPTHSSNRLRIVFKSAGQDACWAKTRMTGAPDAHGDPPSEEDRVVEELIQQLQV